MAGATHTQHAATAEVLPPPGSAFNPWKIEIDELKEEVATLNTMMGSLAEELKELKRIKEEAETLEVPKVVVKTEPSEPESGGESEGTSVQQDPSGDQPVRIEYGEQEQTNPGGGSTSATDNEQIASTPPQRQTTQELLWATPPRREPLFRPNPNYVRRIPGANRGATEPSRLPTPPPELREESPPPRRSPSSPPHSLPFHHLPPPPEVVLSRKPFGIIPASQMKRERNFELIIEIPAKRFKASRYPEPVTSSNVPVASSSRIVLQNSVGTALHPPMDENHTQSSLGSAPRKVISAPFKVTLPAHIRDVTVTRSYMRAHFGAHQSFSYSEPRPDQVAKHGYDHFILVHAGTPQAPSAPGSPGIVTLFDEKPWPKRSLYRIFVRVCPAPAQWKYMGLYKATKLPAWTPAEMKQQGRSFKGYWARTIRQSMWARPIVTRIMLRKELGREPTKDEVEDQMKKNKRSVVLPSLDMIAAALESGEEKIYPWKLECKAYEKNLQQEIALTSTLRNNNF